LLDRADVIILDAHGVFWNGKSFYENSREFMQTLTQSGKLVYVLTNATQLSSESIENFKNKEGGGIIPGVHYHHLITSGEFARSILMSGKLKFKGKKNLRRVYIMGIPNKQLFEGTQYTVVDKPEEADFVYLSVPKLMEEQFNNYPHKEYLKESGSKSHGYTGRNWNSLVIDPFMADLKKFKRLGLPMLSACPDLTAEEALKDSPERNFVIRQGSIVEEYIRMGGEAINLGKPDRRIYKFILDDIKSRGLKVRKDRILMVGDTIATDMRGAQNVGIKSCLCIETGVTAKEIQKLLAQKLEEAQAKGLNGEKDLETLKGEILDMLLKRESTKVDYLIRGLSVNYSSNI
jgi:HAD superfamily hydrolase (TIGR01450 family)